MVKRLHQDRSEGHDGNFSEELLAHLRGRVWNRIDNDGSFSTLAEEAGLNEATISRLMWHNGPKYPQTRRPQFETVVRLMRALGCLDLLRSAFVSTQAPIRYGATKHVPVSAAA